MITEGNLTQIAIAVFAVVFVFSICWLKWKIEYQIWNNKERVKKTKGRLKTMNHQEKVLRQQLLSESLNHHSHNIIAASLKLTLSEELQRVQHMKDSIKLVQRLPNSPRLDGLGPSVFSYGINEENDRSAALEENGSKREPKREQKTLQSKVWQTWRTGGKIWKIKNTDRKVTEPKRNVIKNNLLHKNNEIQQNAKKSCILIKSKNYDSKKSKTINVLFTLKNGVKVQSQHKRDKPSSWVKACLSNKVHDDKAKCVSAALGGISQPSSQHQSPTIKDKQSQGIKTAQPKQPNKQNCNSLRYKTNLTSFSKVSRIIMAKKYNRREIIITKRIHKNQVKAWKKPKFVFKFDLFNCIKGQDLNKKSIRRCENKTSKELNQSEEGISIVSTKYCNTRLRKVINCSSNFVLKVPIKFEKKITFVKFIFYFILKKENKHPQEIFTEFKEKKMRTNNRNEISSNRCKLQLIPKLCNKESQNKKCNLYTNTSVSLMPFQHCPSSLPIYEQFLVGDYDLVNKDDIDLPNYVQEAEPNCSRELIKLESHEDITETVIKRCNAMSMVDSLVDYYMFCQRYMPQKKYELNHLKPVLSTILEDSDEEFCEEENDWSSLETESNDEINYKKVESTSEKADSVAQRNNQNDKKYDDILLSEYDIKSTNKFIDKIVISTKNRKYKGNEVQQRMKSEEILDENHWESCETTNFLEGLQYNHGSTWEEPLLDLRENYVGNYIGSKNVTSTTIKLKDITFDLQDQVKKNYWSEKLDSSNFPLLMLEDALFALPGNVETNAPSKKRSPNNLLSPLLTAEDLSSTDDIKGDP